MIKRRRRLKALLALCDSPIQIAFVKLIVETKLFFILFNSRFNSTIISYYDIIILNDFKLSDRSDCMAGLILSKSKLLCKTVNIICETGIRIRQYHSQFLFAGCQRHIKVLYDL